MIGLLILAIVTVYVGFWAWVIIVAKSKWTKIISLFIALAIPFWELPIGYFYFRQHCSKDGGLHITGDIPRSKAILFEGNAGYSVAELHKRGFETVEIRRSGSIARLSPNKEPVKSASADPISEIGVKYAPHQRLPWGITRSDTIATDLRTGQVLARHTRFYWLAPSWRREAAPILGSGVFCHAGRNDPVVDAIARAASK